MNMISTGEADTLAVLHPGASLTPAQGGLTLVSLPDVRLPPGWSLGVTPVWFFLPVGYPAAQPDCFWAAAELRLASGAMPANSAVQPVPGTGVQALWFSWHVTSWRPGVDNVVTFARFVVRRFTDAR